MARKRAIEKERGSERAGGEKVREKVERKKEKTRERKRTIQKIIAKHSEKERARKRERLKIIQITWLVSLSVLASPERSCGSHVTIQNQGISPATPSHATAKSATRVERAGEKGKPQEPEQTAMTNHLLSFVTAQNTTNHHDF